MTFDVVVWSHVIHCPMDKDCWRKVGVIIHPFIPVLIKITCDRDDTIRIRVVTWIATITFSVPFFKPFTLWRVADM